MHPSRRHLLISRALMGAIAALSLLPGGSASASAEPPAEDSLITGPGTVLTYATYLGSSGISESINAVATDAAGNVVVTGTLDGTIPATPYVTYFGGASEDHEADRDRRGSVRYEGAAIR